MSDDLLKALGAVGREERVEAERAAADAPAVSELGRERMVNAALEALDAPARRPAPATAPTKGGRRIALVSVVAMAAAIALFVGLRRDPLPGYELGVQGGSSEWRGDEPGARARVTVRADGTIELLLRPEHPVERPVEARAFASRDGVVKPLPVEVSAQGVARVVGRADQIFGVPEPGKQDTWDVVIAVGDPGRVPASAAEARASRDVRRSEVTVVVTTR